MIRYLIVFLVLVIHNLTCVSQNKENGILNITVQDSVRNLKEEISACYTNLQRCDDRLQGQKEIVQGQSILLNNCNMDKEAKERDYIAISTLYINEQNKVKKQEHLIVNLKIGGGISFGVAIITTLIAIIKK